jgi:hypothetical protein
MTFYSCLFDLGIDSQINIFKNKFLATQFVIILKYTTKT